MPWRFTTSHPGSEPSDRPLDLPSGRDLGTSVRVVVVLVALLLSMTDLLQLRASRIHDIAAAHADSRNLARSLAIHARGTVQAADTLLAGLAERARVDGLLASSLDRLDRLLASRAVSSPWLHRLLILDRNGLVVASGLPHSATAGRAAWDEAATAYFRHHRQDASPALFIDKAVRDGPDLSSVLTVSRRLERQDGEFLGVAVVEIAVSVFERVYDSFDVGGDGVILLKKQDGTVLVRHPAGSDIGPLPGEEPSPHAVATESGQPVADVSLFSFPDLLTSVAPVEGTDLLVVTSRKQSQVLASWRKRAGFHVAALCVVLSALGLLGARLASLVNAHEFDRRMLKLRQAQLLEAQGQSAEALRRLELAERIAHVGNWRISLPDGVLTWSDEVFRIHALQQAHFKPTISNVLDLYDPADVPLIKGAVEKAIGSGDLFEVCLRVRRPDGAVRHVLTRGMPQFDPGGRTMAIFGVSIDITEQKAIETRLLNAQAETAAANRALEAIAMQDGLTGLANRRQFDRALHHEFRRAVRTGTSLALVLIDVDRFKEFNDRYGHPSGDACLRAISSIIPALANRPGDLVARYGGEEIAILLPGSDIPGTRAVAEAVAQAVRDLRVIHAGSEAGFVTVSAGFEAFEPAHKHDVAGELVQRADIALYAAKRDGRNVVRWYGEIQPYESDALAG